MKNIDEQIKQKEEQLNKVGREINQSQKTLQQKQVEALKLDGAISALKELEKDE
ncbi:hypothetical protein LCGC14_0971600 [marine sediment metagenome]|uniref:Uncharacterized protein n=1 Tax=marine sediment metagenome TaxID=412755 RepID=A0A0F9NXR7_9ZZZZ